MSKTRINELIDILNKDTEAYDKGNPILSENEWNSLYFELCDLEEKMNYRLPNSPTQKIHYAKVSSLEEVEHNHPMLSLNKTKNINDLKDFFSPYEYIGMLKMDGLTCSLSYENGVLVSAETRGDGVKGENVLHNALVIPSIPKRIPCYEKITIDGEIICKKNDFADFSDNYKNARNFAAGSIRLLDNKECSQRPLTFVAWDIISSVDKSTLSEKLDLLNNLHFTTVPYKVSNNPSSIEDIIWNLTELADAKSYPIDGVVFKFNNCKFFEAQGRTDHHFKGGMAYKFMDETYETNLIDVEWTMGRTGVLTPVAVFQPVEIDGCEVTRASLHNVSIMNEILGVPYVNQEIKVFKANQIIPQIKSAHKSMLVDNKFLFAPRTCPICGEATSIKESDSGTKELLCTNPQCEGKLINRLDHFCGKKGLDIKGLSKATLEKLVDWEWINKYEDIFNLENHKMEWITKSGFGEKSVTNILNSIEIGKTCALDKFIAALGIPLIGSRAAKDLAKQFGSWEMFIEAINIKFNFYALPNFGSEMHSSLLKFDYSEAIELAKILNIEPYIFKQSQSSLNDMTFVITGKLQNYKNRVELKSKIESLGGKVVDSISSKTTYLINNDINSSSSKNKKAKDLNIPIITEEEFERMV